MSKVDLTSDELKAIDSPLLRSDWVRILRSALEREKAQPPLPPGNHNYFIEVVEKLLSEIVSDAGFARSQREGLRSELDTCSEGELAVMVAALLKKRNQ